MMKTIFTDLHVSVQLYTYVSQARCILAPLPYYVKGKVIRKSFENVKNILNYLKKIRIILKVQHKHVLFLM